MLREYTPGAQDTRASALHEKGSYLSISAQETPRQCSAQYIYLMQLARWKCRQPVISTWVGQLQPLLSDYTPDK